jgi:hypothetical protein
LSFFNIFLLACSCGRGLNHKKNWFHFKISLVYRDSQSPAAICQQLSHKSNLWLRFYCRCEVRCILLVICIWDWRI